MVNAAHSIGCRAGYVGFYDFSFCVFIVYQIYVVGRKSMYNLHGATAVGMATSKAAAASKMDTSSVSVSASANGAAPPTASMTPGSPTSPTESAPVKNDFARIKAEFQAQVRDTIISLVLFFAFTVLGTACSKASTDYFAGVFTMENMLTGIAFSQIAVGSAGPHVAFISLMLYNVALLVRTSHGQSSKSRWRTRGKKSASSDRDDDNDEGSAPSKSMSRK
ncbi:hypothetical protein HK105_206638 [Polyrhizophydium stewartii]|uniref:Uncharacterized protein n=1 Tax=Polyrhizophydium stewartii TaxID=2732419 RepID=A0ABR4N332_9FUNG